MNFLCAYYLHYQIASNSCGDLEFDGHQSHSQHRIQNRRPTIIEGKIGAFQTVKSDECLSVPSENQDTVDSLAVTFSVDLAATNRDL